MIKPQSENLLSYADKAWILIAWPSQQQRQSSAWCDCMPQGAPLGTRSSGSPPITRWFDSRARVPAHDTSFRASRRCLPAASAPPTSKAALPASGSVDDGESDTSFGGSAALFSEVGGWVRRISCSEPDGPAARRTIGKNFGGWSIRSARRRACPESARIASAASMRRSRSRPARPLMR